MTQYQVPQFIDIEDRIVGPLTLKQFLYLAFGGAILFVVWFLFKFYIWIIIAVPTVAAALTFAFLKINDRPFLYFFLSFINYYIKPRLYIFSVIRKEVKTESLLKERVEIVPETAEKITRSKLKELALNLDTRK